MLKESAMYLPESVQLQFSEAKANLAQEQAHSGLDTRSLFNLFTPLAVNALRLAYDTKRELLFIMQVLFPKYLDPIISAMARSEPIPGASLSESLAPSLPLQVFDMRI